MIAANDPRRTPDETLNGRWGRALPETLPAGMALASIGSGVIHLSTAGEHSGLFGVAFLAMAAFQLAWAVAVILRPGQVVLLTGIAGQGAIVATWVAAHTSGLPFGPGAGEPEVSGLKDVAATLLEVAVIVGALLLLSARSNPRWRTAFVPHGLVTAATVALTALTIAAVMSPHAAGGHPHGEEAAGAHSSGVDEHDDAAAADDHHGDAADHDIAMAGPATSAHGADGHGGGGSDSGGGGMQSDHGHGSSPGHMDPADGANHHSGTGGGGGGGHENGGHQEAGGHQGHGKAEHGAHVAAVGGPGPYSWRWDPAEVKISVGQMVEWGNRTDLEHHVTFYDGPIRKSLHLEADDGKTSYVFRKPGTYLYRCNITYHSEMFMGRCVGQCGSITVRD